MKPAIRMIVEERRPIVEKIAALIREVRALEAQLEEVGAPNATNAAVRIIRKKPGLLTSEIIEATGIDLSALSRLKRWGVLRHDGRHGRGGESRWYHVAASSTVVRGNPLKGNG